MKKKKQTKTKNKKKNNRCQYRLLSENNSPPPPRLFPFSVTFALSDLTLGSCDCFFYHLWSFRSWLPRIIVGTNYQRNSEDRNAPITAGENHPITAEHNASLGD